MKLGFAPEDEAFRAEAAAWLESQMAGDFADIRHIQGLTACPERRKLWEQRLGEARWSCIGWPTEWGGRGATLARR